MVNPYRGEVALEVDGEARVMRLSLGALAALEAELGEGSLVALAERFEAGRFSASDLLALLAAGLGMERAALAEARIGGGPMAAARAGARLLAVTFAVPGSP
ncbi:gene transfer agent family protein [Halovulum dunhuangense]|uniref:Gene transfer agent family protein n=1 Tax=Halovulum dunhuangense TaxID=1505036 RepID=A0A849L721_9RHOB|nr:GTA-gp10 family protein [Halovulum dunhuangense]NNU81910.1 gene transfer agent family protein [Halovulum dunhuangense]